jgi:uncharacterized alpha-E superfamily protein
VLSRIAECLFWVGRYVERADDTARMLDVYTHHLVEVTPADEAEICQSLIRIMGLSALVQEQVTGDGRPVPSTATTVTQLLAFDARNPSSIVSAMTAARANARGASEAISSEMWEALNATYNALPAQVNLGRSSPYGFFRFVRERAAILAGLTESSMSRDDAWRFLVLGRSLERIDMLARLLSSAVSSPSLSVDWVVLLRSFSGHEAFLRTYRREPEPTSAAEFLLLDRMFPRSVFSALSTAEDRLAELDPRSDRVGTPDQSRRLLGQLRAHLEYRSIEDHLQDFRGLLDRVQRGCGDVNLALASRYFRQANLISWTPGDPGEYSESPSRIGS